MVDNRSFPFSAMALIGDSIGGVGHHGSGVLIAPDEVLTAAHIVWDSGIGPATGVFVQIARNGSDMPNPTVAVDRFHYIRVSNAGGQTAPDQVQEDFALLHLAQPVSGVSAMSMSPGFQGGAVHITGYPDSAGVVNLIDAVIQVVPDATTATYDPNAVLGTGSSGGPVWSGSSVFGVISTSSRDAALSAPTVDLINAWIAEDRSSTVTGGIAVAPIDIHTISSSLDRATVFGSFGGDSVTGTGNFQWLVAGAGNERLTATGANSILFGGSGADTLVGSGPGSFMLAGGGATTMVSGPGAQGMAGGAAADLFQINAGQASGFVAIYNKGGSDLIEIHAIAGSPVDTLAEALAFELSDGANSFVYLGENSAGAMWLITVGTAHLAPTDIFFA